MIVIIDEPGQLCNQLWAYSPFVAFSAKHKVPLRILGFSGYASLFNGPNQDEDVRFIRRSVATRLLLKTFIPVLRKLNATFDPGRMRAFLFEKQAAENWPAILGNRSNLVFLNSWKHTKDNQSLLELKDTIKRIFTPKDAYTKRPAQMMEEARRSFDVIVGVHIRMGDYASWGDGRYFFDYPVYLKQMSEIQKQLTERGMGKVGFFLCSNAPFDKTMFQGVHVARLEPRPEGVEDLFALSMCDYIFGPPSTFSMWASFYGGAPLKFLMRQDENLRLENFSRIVSQNLFEDGSTLRLFAEDPKLKEVPGQNRVRTAGPD